MKSILLISFLLLMCLCSQAQSYLLAPSTNASFITGCIGVEEKALYYSTSVGLSLDGRFDLFLSGSHKEENRYLAFNALSIGANYLVLKQRILPFSLGLSAEYEYKGFPVANRLKHNTAKLGISLYRTFKINENVSLIPGVYGKLNLARYKIEDYYANNDRTYTINVQNTLLLKNFSITPAVSYTEKRRYLFTIQLGILLFKRESIK